MSLPLVLNDEQMATLEARAREENVSPAELASRAVMEFLYERPAWGFTNDAGVCFRAEGGEGRYQILLDVADQIDNFTARAAGLIRHFIKREGSFEPDTVEVTAAPDDDGASIILTLNFIADDDPDEFVYEYFKVFFPTPSEYGTGPTKFEFGFQ